MLWRGPEPLPGVGEFFAFLRAQGIDYALATNNSTKTVQSYQERLASLGIPTRPEQVITSAVATTEHVRHHYAPGTPVYVIGEMGIRQALAEAGFPEDPAAARLVVVGLDFGLTYDMLKTATLRINAGADFIGTNGDLTFPLPEGIAPGMARCWRAPGSDRRQAAGHRQARGRDVRGGRGTAGRRAGAGGDDRRPAGNRHSRRAAGGLKTILVLSGVVSAAAARVGFRRMPSSKVADLHRAWAQVLESVS